MLVVSDPRPGGLETKIWEGMLRIAFKGPDENFDNFIKEAIALWKNGIKYQFICANPSRYVSSTSGASCSITPILFPNSKDAD